MFQIQSFLDYVLYGISAGVLVIWFATIIITIIRVNKEKEEVYRCLTSLQNNVVSAIADKLKIIKKTEASSFQASESDLNKQEENMLKIFGTAGDGSGTNKSFIYANVATAVLVYILLIIASVYITEQTKAQADEVTTAAPQISTLLGSFAYQQGVLSNVLSLYYYQTYPNWTAGTLINVMANKQRIANRYFNEIRFGNENQTKSPLKLFLNELREEQAVCLQGTTNEECSTPDILFMFLDYYADAIIVPYQNDVEKTVSMADVLTMWTMANTMLYGNFMEPIFQNIVRNISITVRTGMISPIIISIIIIIVIIIIEIIMICINTKMQKQLRMTLRLLQHCPPHVVLQSSRIMSVLSGNFGNHKFDSTTRDTDYYMEILQNMPDAILIINHGIIVAHNKAALRLFDKDKDKSFRGRFRLILSAKMSDKQEKFP